MIIPFSPPYIDNDVELEVLDTLRSGWITTGPKVKALESEISNYTGCQKSLCVNSWSSGALLVMKWFGIGPGDEVIIPAYTYSATALAVIHCGATPVMIDILDDLTIDPDQLKSRVTSRTKVIIPVDIGGLMCKYDEIKRIVNLPDVISKFQADNDIQAILGRILILSDAAHSLGARYKDTNSGCAADITIFSLHAVKNVTTAEGGVICLNLPKAFDNSEVYEIMRLWTLNGQTKDAFTKSKTGGWRYDILFAGLKVNMPDLCAAVGLAQIRKYPSKLMVAREMVAMRYYNFFKQFEWADIPILSDEERVSSFHLFALKIKGIDESKRDRMIDYISKRGVGVNVHFIPLPMLTLFQDLGYRIESFPKAYDSYSREISLPIYPQLTTEEVNYICNVVSEAYQLC